jgi:hypothetical protein
MPSSISNFDDSTMEPRAVTAAASGAGGHNSLRPIIVLLALLTVGQVGLEFGVDWLMQKHGKNEIRWGKERKAAEALVHDGKGVLIIGSSIVRGINGDELQKEMPDWTVRTLVMSGAGYTDWVYSLRRLMKEGVRPNYVVVPPLPFQLWVGGFRGDYLPLHWMDRQDIWRLAKSQKLDMNSTANLFYASFNSFFALREDARNAYLGNMIPGHKVLVAGLPDKRVYKSGEVEQLVSGRLADLQTELAPYGAKLMILHYPIPGMEADWRLIERVAKAKNISFVSAVASTPQSYFEDPYHLNDQGMEYYTKALGPALNAELSRSRRSLEAGN